MSAISRNKAQLSLDSFSIVCGMFRQVLPVVHVIMTSWEVSAKPLVEINTKYEW